MKAAIPMLLVSFAAAGVLWAARCTTALEPGILNEYETYVARAERAMAQRFEAAPGEAFRRNVSDTQFNRGIAGRNGTVIHWMGAIRIPGATLDDLGAVLRDYEQYARFYRPMITECRAERRDGPFDTILLRLHSSFRFASLFPQHYAFEARALVAPPEPGPRDGTLRMHLRATRIRESDSGIPGRDDFLEPHRDHGIMWALNAYWRARQRGPDLLLEFETITLARSVETFACKVGFIPVPRTVVAGAMNSLPAESVAIILEGTRAECVRRAALRAGGGGR